jgi:magnesium and cobalt transporter
MQGASDLEDESQGLLTSLFHRLFRGKPDFSMEKHILSAKDEGDLKNDEVAMLLNVLRLGRKKVSEIMIPRTDITCADISDPLESIVDMIISSGHSRIPLYRKSKDDIVGIIHAKDLLKYLSVDDKAPLEQIMRLPLFIPETKNVKDMLQVFQVRKIHLAIAQDEYGGTSGLVTFEDVLEEIVGEIEDEYDLPKPEEIRVLENNDILVAGRTSLDELEAHLGVSFDTEQVETLSGYVCALAGRVPRQGEVYESKGLRFKVRESDNKQIHWLLITPEPVENGNQS